MGKKTGDIVTDVVNTAAPYVDVAPYVAPYVAPIITVVAPIIISARDKGRDKIRAARVNRCFNG